MPKNRKAHVKQLAHTGADVGHRVRETVITKGSVTLQLEALWADPVVRAPHHVAGHLTEAQAIARNKGYYKGHGREPYKPVDLIDDKGNRFRQAAPVRDDPLGRPTGRAIVAKAFEPSDELVVVYGRKAPEPRRFIPEYDK